MPFEAKRFRFIAVPVPVFAVVSIIAAGPRQQSTEPRYDHLVRCEAGIGRHSGKTVDRGLGGLRVVITATREQRLHQCGRRYAVPDHLAAVEEFVDEPVQRRNGVIEVSVVGLGLLPVGLAFYVWDYGVKNGDIQILGASSYAAPLLSTLILIIFGFGELSVRIGLSCLLITGGAVLVARDMVFRNKERPN